MSLSLQVDRTEIADFCRRNHIRRLAFFGSALREDSLTRLLEILGEADNRVPEEVRSKHAGIPWSQLVGLRNRLIHAYDDVDLDILWEIVTRDLPPLADALEGIA